MSPMPIFNASSVKLNENSGTLPNVQGAILDWFRQLTFTMIKKDVVDFKLKETTISQNFLGMIQPFTAQQLAMKPEGQREWIWSTIHALPSLILKIDDRMVISNVPYRVMYKRDWKDYGYVEYQVIEDYERGAIGCP